MHIIRSRNILFLFVLLSACVPAKQFQELQEKQIKCEDELSLLKEENKNLQVQNNELGAKVDILENQLKTLRKDSLEAASKVYTLTQKYDKLNRQYSDLEATQKKLLEGSVNETRRLLEELQSTQGNLQEKEDRLLQLESKLNSEKSNLEQLQEELEERNKRLVELEQILHAKDSAVLALKNKVTTALLGFEGKGLNVFQKNGKVYVSLEDKLLFSSGSTSVEDKGVRALKELASVLEKNPDINIMVEGHTDDVPYIPGDAIKDNWDLSVKRATAIVRILMENSTIEGKRIIAAGRSKYLPIDPQKTDEARRKNRRTEIILTPQLDELFKILNAN